MITFRKGHLHVVFLTKTMRIMQLGAVFILGFCLHVTAAGKAQKISLSAKDISLTQVLAQVKMQTGFKAVYDKNVVRLKKVNVEAKALPLAAFLQQLLAPLAMEYVIENKTIFIRAIREKHLKDPDKSSSLLLPPPITVRGRILNEKGEPVVASVIIKGTKRGTTSNANGEFELDNVDENAVIVISATNIKSIEFPVDSTNDLRISVTTIANPLEEIVFKGYYTESKRLSTGNVSTVSSNEIDKQPVTNVLSALSGRVPGLVVQTTNGLPGGNINIQIRGKGSIQAGTNPLYVIDGVPFDGQPIASETAIGYFSIVGNVNPLNSLNPNDIGSISVLKDADATAIYGSRGSNGVILITTKKGQEGVVKTSVDIYQGINNVASLPKMIGAKEYFQIRREAFFNDGKTPSADPNSFDYAPDLTVWDTTKTTDWNEYLFGGTGRLTNVQAGISGGTSGTNFSISGNYRNEQSYLRGDNNYARGGIHTSLRHTSANKKFRVSITNAITADNNHTANSQNLSIATLPAPNYPLVNENGEYNWMAGSNPSAELLAKNKISTNNIFSSFSASYTLTDDLIIKINAGYNRISVKQVQLYPAASLYPGTLNYSLFANNVNQSFIIEPQIDYQLPFFNNKLSLVGGATYQRKSGEGTYLEARNFSNEGLMENLASAGVIDVRRSNFTEYKFAAIFGRAAYVIGDRYIFNATIRRDGSSRFGPGHQFGNFGAIGAAWIFSEAKWIKEQLPMLSYGKLRSSYGLTGNDQIADFQYLSTYENSGFVYEGISGLQPARAANRDFRWESTKKFELAAELGLFDNRINLSVSKYINRSSNQLINYTLPNLTGFSGYQANLPAVVENSGLEISLISQNVKQGKLNWSTSFNITFPRNKLISFDNFENSSYAKTLAIGYDITRIIGYRFLGIDDQTGTAIYRTENDDPASFPDYYQTIGKQTPDFYGGLGNTFQWRKFSLDIFLQFTKQKTVGGIFFTPGWMYQTFGIMEERWQQPGDKTSIPMASTGLDFNYFQSSANFFDASYLRIKNISASYNISFARTTSTLRIYSEAQNVFTLWNKRSALVDPESGALSTAQKNLPPVRSLIVGMQFTF